MVRLQEWWREESGNSRRDCDSTEAIKKAMAIVMTTRYEIWKQRSSTVIEEEGPAKIVMLMKMVTDMSNDTGKVEMRDRHLFRSNLVPTMSSGEQQITDWIEAVERSKTRQERKIRNENERLAREMREQRR